MRLRLLAVGAAFTMGCSSAGGGGDVPGAAPGGDEQVVDITVVNRSEITVSVFAVWPGSRNRLGEVGIGRTRVFRTDYRGTDLVLGIDPANVPPAGTSQGPIQFDPQTTRRTEDMLMTGSVQVDAGDQILFEIRRVSPRLDVFWRMLVP